MTTITKKMPILILKIHINNFLNNLYLIKWINSSLDILMLQLQKLLFQKYGKHLNVLNQKGEIIVIAEFSKEKVTCK
jgi:hypothetical protein